MNKKKNPICFIDVVVLVDYLGVYNYVYMRKSVFMSLIPILGYCLELFMYSVTPPPPPPV